jgi:hypothetical protein
MTKSACVLEDCWLKIIQAQDVHSEHWMDDAKFSVANMSGLAPPWHRD